MEWQLHICLFIKIHKRFGKFDVDVFALFYSFQFLLYVSYLLDAKAMTVNAFHLTEDCSTCMILLLLVSMERFSRK